MYLSQIDFAKLRDEFAGKVRRKHAALQDIRDLLEAWPGLHPSWRPVRGSSRRFGWGGSLWSLFATKSSMSKFWIIIIIQLS